MDPLEKTREIYEAFGRADLETIVRAMHPRIEWISNADRALLPWGGRREGIGGATSFFAALMENLEFEAFEPREFFTGADFVTVTGFTRARMRASGKVFESEWAHLFRYQDGQLILFREFYDTHVLVAAFNGANTKGHEL